ncbi:hypothetical protein [Paenibacillus sp. FSL L8-0709]
MLATKSASASMSSLTTALASESGGGVGVSDNVSSVSIDVLVNDSVSV